MHFLLHLPQRRHELSLRGKAESFPSICGSSRVLIPSSSHALPSASSYPVILLLIDHQSLLNHSLLVVSRAYRSSLHRPILPPARVACSWSPSISIVRPGCWNCIYRPPRVSSWLFYRSRSCLTHTTRLSCVVTLNISPQHHNRQRHGLQPELQAPSKAVRLFCRVSERRA